MTAIEKLIDSIKTNPKNLRFTDACKIARHIGFIHKGGKGSHCAFGRYGEVKLLNFQNKKGCIPVYQAKQLLEMLKKYEKK